jgi:hypothetical protein
MGLLSLSALDRPRLRRLHGDSLRHRHPAAARQPSLRPLLHADRPAHPLSAAEQHGGDTCPGAMHTEFEEREEISAPDAETADGRTLAPAPSRVPEAKPGAPGGCRAGTSLQAPAARSGLPEPTGECSLRLHHPARREACRRRRRCRHASLAPPHGFPFPPCRFSCDPLMRKRWRQFQPQPSSLALAAGAERHFRRQPSAELICNDRPLALRLNRPAFPRLPAPLLAGRAARQRCRRAA